MALRHHPAHRARLATAALSAAAFLGIGGVLAVKGTGSSAATPTSRSTTSGDTPQVTQDAPSTPSFGGDNSSGSDSNGDGSTWSSGGFDDPGNSGSWGATPAAPNDRSQQPNTSSHGS